MAPSDARPLSGRRIAVTRAPEQSVEFASRLESLGAQVIYVPMVQFLEPEKSEDLDAAIARLGEFDWVLFTSANAARFFLRRCRARRRWPEAPDEKVPRIAAVGNVTRAAIEAEGQRVALVPAEFSGTALAAAFGGEAAGKKMLIPRSDVAEGDLPAALRAAGAEVTEVIAYRTVEAEGVDEASRSLLREPADAVTFFSPSAFRHFANALGGAEAIRKLAGQTALAAVGPTTAALIRELGLGSAVVEAGEATGASLAEALERYFEHRAPGPAAPTKGSDHVSH